MKTKSVYALYSCAAILLSAVSACNQTATTPTQPIVIVEGKPDAKGSGDPHAGGGAAGSATTWTTDQWRDYFFDLARDKGGPSVTFDGLSAMRAELLAKGADWQNGWRGDYRPRIFLPVPDCPPPDTEFAPDCAWSRAVDVGDWGGSWVWIPRF